jgi:putative NIF3 family GTP cyclohydrolase 1 type 2
MTQNTGNVKQLFGLNYHRQSMNRRKFVTNVSGTLGALTIAGLPLDLNCVSPQETMTIQDAIDLIIRSVPGSPFEKTVDTIKSGDPKQLLKGIVTTMFATVDVIEKAIQAGANLIIAHEPTFYNHQDNTDWLKNDDVYKYKQALLDKSKVVIWRCHDYIHTYKPDGVYEGVLTKLGWKGYADPANLFRVTIPSNTLQSIITLSKERLGIERLRYIGDPTAQCKKICLMVGAAGGMRQMPLINAEKPDLVMIGELVEWETLEYLRDLRSSGSKTSLIILGHIPSEEPGMEWLAKWLEPQLKSIPVKHIPSGTVAKWA